MRHYFIVPLSAFLLLIVSPAFAETVTFTREYTYQASEFDSKHDSRTLALETVKKLLFEELGTYLAGETAVKGMRLTKDRLTTYSAGIVDAEIVDEKWDGKSYWLKAKVSADPQEAAKALKKLIEDRSKTEELEETRKKTEELTKENERLRRELEAGVKSTNHDKKTEAKKIEAYGQTIRDLNAVEWVKKGVEAGLAERYKEALDAFTKAIELKPDYAHAYDDRGNEYSVLGDYEPAIKDYTKAIELEPDDAVIYNNRGNAYGKSGSYQQAIRDFDKAIELNPGDADVYYNRGLTYKKMRNYEQVIRDYNKAIKLRPDFSEAYGNRGIAYRNLGNYEQAIKDYTKAIELKPDNADVYNNRGNAYGELGNYRQAVKDYTKAIELKPDFGDAYGNRGIAYGKLGSYHQAIKDFKIAALLGNQDAQAYLIKQGVQW